MLCQNRVLYQQFSSFLEIPRAQTGLKMRQVLKIGLLFPGVDAVFDELL